MAKRTHTGRQKTKARKLTDQQRSRARFYQHVKPLINYIKQFDNEPLWPEELR